MLNITEKQKEVLKEYIPNYESFDDIGDILSELNDVMLETLDDDYESTKETTIVSKLYDQLYSQNE